VLLYGQGRPVSPVAAVECFRSAAAVGDGLAMHFMGECATKGLGMAADPAQAVQWYRRGAELNNAGCLAELGECLERGLGVTKDLGEALLCYERALALGFDAVSEAIERVRSLQAGGRVRS